MTAGKTDDRVGSVAEEALKLLEALCTSASGPDEPVAGQRTDCRSCPVCAGRALLRGISPQVKEHLTSAAHSVMLAASALLETTVEEPAARDRAAQEADR